MVKRTGARASVNKSPTDRPRAKTKTKEQLREYQEKRDFEKSPEPPSSDRPKDVGITKPAFVIHRHDARNLHFDLRLEMEGVLKSWAVPKGISYKPRDKHLAVQTEDHPIEYLDFHGSIPSGQYGAGTMTIWDRGTYDLPNSADGVADIENGKIEFRLDGGRLCGEWHMVRMKGENNQWLLFKAKDRFARSDDEPSFALDLAMRPESPMPRSMEFMTAVRPGTGANLGIEFPSDWVFEPWLSDDRVHVRFDEQTVQILHRGKDVAPSLPEICTDVRKMRSDRACLDGVLVCLDENGQRSPELLGDILAKRAMGVAQLYVFDLLFHQRWDLRALPLRERKAALASLLPPHLRVVYVDHERSHVGALIQAVADAGLQGLMARRCSSVYSQGRSNDWVEIPVSAANCDELVEQLSTTRRGDDQDLESRELRFTNQHKILWPRDGFTKGDLIDFYDLASDVMLPHLKDRPLSIKRYPNGIDGQSFFQKDAPDHTPDWIQTGMVGSGKGREDKEIQFVLCNDRPTLLYLANLAAIELHPFMSRMASLDSPDWVVIDLDPYGIEFKHVISVAKTLGEILHEATLRPYLKTSGSKGLHIFLPLAEGYTYQQGRMFCEGVANLAVTRHREIATMERVRSNRVGMLYLDCLQNHRGQTVVAPYVARPVPGATVSTPIAWEELDDLDPSQFTLETVGKRFEAYGDLFRGVLDDRQDLAPAIDRIRDMATQ